MSLPPGPKMQLARPLMPLAAAPARDAPPCPAAHRRRWPAPAFARSPIARGSFLPARGAERRRALGRVAASRRAAVLYEAPHRLRATLADLASAGGGAGGGRGLVAAREMTKVWGL